MVKKNLFVLKMIHNCIDNSKPVYEASKQACMHAKFYPSITLPDHRNKWCILEYQFETTKFINFFFQYPIL